MSQTLLAAELELSNLTMKPTEPTAAMLVHLDVLYNLAVWLAGDATEAQALVEETYRRALHTVPRQLSGTKLRVRLLTIMWEICGQHHGADADGPSEGMLENSGAAKRPLFQTLSRVDLDAGLRHLPKALRAAVILADMEEHPLEEVGEVLGWSRQQVQAALTRARCLLDNFLQTRLTSSQILPAAEDENEL